MGKSGVMSVGTMAHNINQRGAPEGAPARSEAEGTYPPAAAPKLSGAAACCLTWALDKPGPACHAWQGYLT